MAVAYPDVEWMFTLCDLSGVALSRLSRVASNKHLEFALNRPAMCSFTVPSNDPRVNIVHTDSDPYLATNNRVIKGYRKESGSWTIRYAGVVTHLEDYGDGTKNTTSVTSYDPWFLLNSRLVRKNSTPDLPDAGAAYAPGATAGNTLAKNQVDWTNTLGETGIRTSGGTHTFNTTTSQTVSWDRGRTIGDALVELTDTATMDVYLLPVDLTSGKLVDMSVFAAMGSNKPSAVFGYGTANHAIVSFTRVVDGSQLANKVTWDTGTGGATAGTLQSDATSVTKYHPYEAMTAGVTMTATFADTLAAEELAFRKNPRRMISIKPAPERAPQPWTDYWLGDTIQVYCSNDLRESIAGTQRVYGVSIDIDDNGFERVSELRAQAD